MSLRRQQRRRRRGLRARSHPWRRLLLRLGLVGAVVVAGWLLHLHVSLGRVFEGRLWQLPSRLYSSPLVLRGGARLSLAELTARLERSGYHAAAGAPARPGEFALGRSRVELYLREFSAAGEQERERRVVVRIEDGGVRSLRDDRGRYVERVVLEPEVLATLHGERQEEREPVRLEQVPRVLTDAVLAAEDARFFDHHGLDPRGILRAAWANLRQGRVVQGGSTISQQTIKNLMVGQRRTWWRKLREGVLSVMLEARYPKRRILEVYLNHVYLGQRGSVAICGVQAAAAFYFGRGVEELTLAESALLAGLIRSPGRYNPFVDPARARARRDQVLEAMARLGLAEPEAARAARATPLELAAPGRGFAGGSYAVDYVRAQLAELGSASILETEGLRIETTLDTRWQAAAEAAAAAGLARLEPQLRGRRPAASTPLEIAILVLRVETGEILALVGGADHGRSQFNRAVQARRQPGSCFKPFVFVAGLEAAARDAAGGLTAATVLDDAPLELSVGGKRWSPQNFDRIHRGPVTVRRALEESLNVPTVRAAGRVGLDPVIRAARACGIESRLPAVPSLALGAVEVTPLELATAFATLARRGERVDPWVVRQVTDREGRTLLRGAPRRSQVISRQTAFIVHDLLQGVFERGTAAAAAELGFPGPAAGKTGTTDDTRDAWFVGDASGVLALVWLGHDDNSRTGLTGASGALPVWVDLMLRGPLEPEVPAAAPWGLVVRRVDAATGGLALGGCPEWRDEWFVRGTEPTRPCSEHRAGLLRRWLQRLGPRRDRSY